MTDKPSKPTVRQFHGPDIKWKLDSRHTSILFTLARERAEEQIQNYRMRLIELARFDPQPQQNEPVTETFGHFDHRTKQDRMADLNRWIESEFRLVRKGIPLQEWQAGIAEMYDLQHPAGARTWQRDGHLLSTMSTTAMMSKPAECWPNARRSKPQVSVSPIRLLVWPRESTCRPKSHAALSIL